MLRSFIIILISPFINSCEPTKKKQYKVSLDSAESLYFNHFNKRDYTYWIGNDGEYYAEINEGYYYFESMDSVLRFNTPEFQISESEISSNERSLLFLGQITPQNIKENPESSVKKIRENDIER